MNPQESLLHKIVKAPSFVAELSRYTRPGTGDELVNVLLRRVPTVPNPYHKLEEWRAIVALAQKFDHAESSQTTIGHLLPPGRRSDEFMEKLQKASPKRAALLVRNELGRLPSSSLDIVKTGRDLLTWKANRTNIWVKWARAYYLNSASEE